MSEEGSDRRNEPESSAGNGALIRGYRERETVDLTDREVRSVVSQLWNRSPEAADNVEGFREGEDLFEEAPIGITIGVRQGDDHPLLYANRAFCELTGYCEEELLNRDCRLLQGDKTDPERVAEIADALRCREPITVELQNYRKDGSMFWNRLSISPLNVEDRDTQAFVGFQEDVTERRMVEENLREQIHNMRDITDSMPGVTYEFWRSPDGEYEISYMSDGFEHLTGVSVEQAQSNFSSVVEAVHPEDRDRMIQSIEQSASTLSTWRCEYRYVHENGDVTWVMGASVPEERSEGVVSWRGVLIDITERKELEEELTSQIEETKRVNQLKTDVLARATHDLRTPLNSILGLSSILEDTDLSPDQRRHLKGIESAGRSMLFLVNDILDLDRIDSGNLTLQTEPLELRSLLYEVMTMFRSQVMDSDVTISETVTERVPEWVVADSERLQRILVNLVGNALKFTGSGRVDVLVDCNERQDERAELLFSVSDTGPGIDEEEQETIFQDRKQGSDPEALNGSGAGLGLSICRHLVKQMNGEIGVKSDPGNGATFWFTVDVELPGQDEIPEAMSVESSVEGAKVLVVDDSSPIRRLLRRLLEDADVDVTTANNGEEAVDVLVEAPDDAFDTLFLDRRMGAMSGPQVINALSERGEGPPPEKIYLISGDTEQEVLEHVPEQRIAGVLNKPIVESDLLASIRASVGADPGTETTRDQLDNQLRLKLDGSPLHVLVADDAPEARHILDLYLEHFADRIDTTKNGREAVRKRFDRSPDIVLMDLEMPEVNGLEAIMEIRERERREGLDPVAIVVQTGRDLGEVKEECEKAGADVFLNKPVDRDDLYRAILKVID